MPSLEFDFRIAVTLNPELSRSETRVHKEIITVASGSWSGSFGNGRVLVSTLCLGAVILSSFSLLTVVL